MHVRVARWEGADPDALAEFAAGIDERSASGPPEGVAAKGLLVLTDRQGGRAMVITLFESEEDMRQGHETLNSMSPPGEGGMGQRSVELYAASTLRMTSEWETVGTADEVRDDPADHYHDAE